MLSSITCNTMSVPGKSDYDSFRGTKIVYALVCLATYRCRSIRNGTVRLLQGRIRERVDYDWLMATLASFTLAVTMMTLGDFLARIASEMLRYNSV